MLVQVIRDLAVAEISSTQPENDSHDTSAVRIGYGRRTKRIGGPAAALYLGIAKADMPRSLWRCHTCTAHRMQDDARIPPRTALRFDSSRIKFVGDANSALGIFAIEEVVARSFLQELSSLIRNARAPERIELPVMDLENVDNFHSTADKFSPRPLFSHTGLHFYRSSVESCVPRRCGGPGDL